MYANGPRKLSPKKKVNISSTNNKYKVLFFVIISMSANKPVAAIKPPKTPAVITKITGKKMFR